MRARAKSARARRARQKKSTSPPRILINCAQLIKCAVNNNDTKTQLQQQPAGIMKNYPDRAGYLAKDPNPPGGFFCP
jgi:hypothetical protein